MPPQVPLGQEDWLELVSSLHDLRKVSGWDAPKALEVLIRQKPRLAPYTDWAEKKLQEVKLLP